MFGEPDCLQASEDRGNSALLPASLVMLGQPDFCPRVTPGEGAMRGTPPGPNCSVLGVPLAAGPS